MSEVKWIHLNIDMFNNGKIKYLRSLPAGNDIVLIWVALLTLAGRCNAGGMIMLTQNVAYTVPMIANEFDFDETTVRLAIEAFEQLGMISNDGFLSITGWEEHQDSEGLDRLREYNRIAKQKSREKQKQKQLQVLNGVNDMSLTSQGTTLDPSISISNSISTSTSISIDTKEDNRGVGKEGESVRNLNKEASQVVDRWNETRLPKVVRVRPDSERGTRLRARLKEFGVEDVIKAVNLAAESDYLQDQHWFDFGWFVRPENFVKVLEGKYNRDVGSNQHNRDGGVVGEGKKYRDIRYSLDPDRDQ